MIKKIFLLLIFLPYLACPGRADIVDKLTDLNTPVDFTDSTGVCFRIQVFV